MDTGALLTIARETVARVPLCFVITANPHGAPNARIVRPGPLRDDWSIGFMTERWCRKVDEMEGAGRFTMAFQLDAERAYVSLQGPPQIVDDPAVKRAIWNADSSRFHPGGPDDPTVVIVRMRVERIELYHGGRGVVPEPAGLCAAVLERTADGWQQSFSSRRPSPPVA